MTDTQKVAKSTKSKTISYYLPLAVAKLQVEVISGLLYPVDRHDPGNDPAFKAWERVKTAAKARLGDVYSDMAVTDCYAARDGVKAYSELTFKELSELTKEAERVRDEHNARHARYKFEISYFTGVNGKIGLAIKTAAQTIKWCIEAKRDLRFVADSGIYDRSDYIGPRRYNHFVESDLVAIFDCISRIGMRAWCMLLLFCGMVGGEVHKHAMDMAARNFTGYKMDSDGLQIEIMHCLTFCHRLPGMYLQDEEDEFRNEIAHAMSNLK